MSRLPSFLHKDDYVERAAIHSFHTLLAALGTRCRNRCRVTSGLEGLTFSQLTEPTPLQQRAFQLLGLVFPVNRKAIFKESQSFQ
jgi:hypothetical protein